MCACVREPAGGQAEVRGEAGHPTAGNQRGSVPCGTKGEFRREEEKLKVQRGTKQIDFKKVSGEEMGEGKGG